MSNPSVAIVIIHWNRVNLLEEFLPSVMLTQYPNLQIVLADNASTDNSVAWVNQNYPQVNCILLDKNYGYAGGYNRALKDINADYFVLLNNDVAVDQNWLMPMIELMEATPNAGAAQPTLLQYKDKSMFEYAGAAGGFMDIFGYVACRGRMFENLEANQQQYSQNKEIFWASGACFVVKAKAYFEAGGLDESFFAHMEEIDLCWRIQQKGYSIHYCANSQVYHLGGSTLQKGNPQKTFLNFRNSLIMLLKNLPLSTLLWLIPYRSFLDLLSSFFFIAKGEFSQSWAIHRAHAQFFFRIGHWWRKRNNQFPKKYWKQLSGVYHGSFVWQHFAKGKKYFSEL